MTQYYDSPKSVSSSEEFYKLYLPEYYEKERLKSISPEKLAKYIISDFIRGLKKDIKKYINKIQSQTGSKQMNQDGITLDSLNLQNAELNCIKQALEISDSKQEAAKKLGISRHMLSRRIKKFGLTDKE